MTALLQVQGLVKRFGGLVATDGASFEVRLGEVHALIGPNGAGKTTLIHQLSGVLRPDAGRVLLDGHDLSGWPVHRRALAGLVRSYQITSIFPRLTVLDNVALAVQAHEPGALRIIGRARADARRYDQAHALLQQVGLHGHASLLAGALAHGQQRQLEIGLALALQPRLLLLDEPMAGMGAQESEAMLALLQRVRQHTTLLLVEHDMDAVFRLADRISVLVGGRIVASGTPAEIARDPLVREAYLGDEALPAQGVHA